MNNIKQYELDYENCNIYKTLFKLKKISNLNFNPMTVIEFLFLNDILMINSNPVKFYASEYNNTKIENPEALFLINIQKIINQLIIWYELLPNVYPYYAVKCNPDPIIIKLLTILGLSFDCASIREINQVVSEINQVVSEINQVVSEINKQIDKQIDQQIDKQIDQQIDTKRIIYANPCKIISHLIESKKLDVKMMTLDCVEELHKIHKYFPDAEIIIRLAVDDSKSVCKFSSKFGCNIVDAKQIIDLANEKSMNIIGVSFHVGSGCKSIESYKTAIEMSSKVFEYGLEQSQSMYLLDVGGGFPGTEIDTNTNTNTNMDVSFEQIAKSINSSIDLYFADIKLKVKLKVIAEPGRFIVSSSHSLLVNIIGKKKKLLLNGSNNEECFSYYINDGVYGSFNCIYFDHFLPKLNLINNYKDDTTLYKSLIFGPTCDSMDVLFKVESYDDFEKKMGDNLLPELELGDQLYIDNFGAYTISAGCEFNGIPRPRKIYFWSDH
jgi:ornithine decarboxylase